MKIKLAILLKNCGCNLIMRIMSVHMNAYIECGQSVMHAHGTRLPYTESKCTTKSLVSHIRPLPSHKLLPKYLSFWRSF